MFVNALRQRYSSSSAALAVATGGVVLLACGENDSGATATVAATSRSRRDHMMTATQISTTACEAATSATTSAATKPSLISRKFQTLHKHQADSYPNFSRHGKNAMIQKYLTPQVYQQLKDKSTASGVTLDDMIRAATSLPMGANPPRGIAGVYAGDAECYSTFAMLLDPIIEEHHRARTRRRGLRRHRTNLDLQHLARRQIDPEGQYILSTRLRLARCIKGYRFAPTITRGERREIENLIKDCCSEWEKNSKKGGNYKSVMDMTNAEHDDLVKRRISFPDPDAFRLSAGTHRDWPDARGLYCNDWDFPSLMVWTNVEDHLWIVSTSKGGNVQDVFSKLSSAAMALETFLQQRGHKFVEDERLGFLNASPANIGTALQASVHVKLVRLGRLPGFDEFVRRLRLEIRTEYDGSLRYNGIFDIGNLEALGKSEVELINVVIDGVGRLIELEKRLEIGEDLDLSEESAW
mmetsp:Transcript_17836/g.23088  ORF Transcript_17836/g.23088 Transcript_17836/m.23088 type:complete len:466 (+) Transcript_17836:195-1592(+)